ncbi:MAG: NUDIX hydrolase [Candidatus Nanohaloarchaea archaeon]
MESIVRRLLKKHVEPIGGRILGRLWAPCSVAVLAHGEHEDVLVLEAAGNHSLPGGLVKGGETLREAARREVKEETGCEVSVGELLDLRYEGLAPGIHFYFEAEVEEAELSGSWEGEPRFVERSEIRELDWELHHSHVHEYLFDEDKK